MKMADCFYAGAGAIAIAIAMAMAIATPAAAQCTGKSPAHTLALVELYTSEGCDSCPPADRWLRSLKPDAGVVPLAMHVDYWDYIGWKDPYASPRYSARQREVAAVNGKTFVYTPQVVLHGRDYRNWGAGPDFAADVKRTNTRAARAGIELSIELQPGGKLRAQARAEVRAGMSAEVSGSRARAEVLLHLAIYQNGLSTAVAVGENRGKTLQHDFVTRAWVVPVSLDKAGNASATLDSVIPGAKPGVTGAVAFVQNRKTGDVLQAYALPLCEMNRTG